MQYTIPAAKAHLSRLIDAALAGEEVVIARGGKPLVKLVAISEASFKIGILEGQLQGDGPDFLEPMREEEIAPWEGGC